MTRSVLIFLPWIFLPPVEKNAFCAVSMAGFGMQIVVRPPAKHWRTTARQFHQRASGNFLRLPAKCFGNVWQCEEFCKIHGARGKSVLTVVDLGRSADPTASK